MSGTKPSPAVDFISGVIAGKSCFSHETQCTYSSRDQVTDKVGAAGLIVGQPFDVVKVRYQTPEYAGRYSSTFAALGKLPELEQGVGANEQDP
jgi:hypothetical protein